MIDLWFQEEILSKMKIINLTGLLQIAGVLHLGLISANALMPRTVNLSAHIAALPQFIRQMFWVYYSFINLCLVSFGLITFSLAGKLASGDDLARAICIFFVAFWTLRLVTGIFVFNMRPYLTTIGRRLGYYAINIVIVYLLIIYAWAAWKGGQS
jgi:hypothetical protein